MPPDPKKLIAYIDQARTALNNARNAVGEWQNGQVAAVNHTGPQRAALRTVFETGLQEAKDRIADIDLELTQ